MVGQLGGEGGEDGQYGRGTTREGGSKNQRYAHGRQDRFPDTPAPSAAATRGCSNFLYEEVEDNIDESVRRDGLSSYSVYEQKDLYESQDYQPGWDNVYKGSATDSFATTTPTTQTNMSYPYGNNQYNYASGYPNSYAQQGQQAYDQAPPAIRNPFPAPPPAHNTYGAQNANYDPEQEALLAQWQSQYAPADTQASKDARGKAETATAAQIGPRPSAAGPAAPAGGKTDNPEKKVTVVRKGGGQTWEDNTLLEWDPTQFRIMVGNLAGEVTDDSLAKAFAPYGVAKARVIRDKRTTKSKGFGFVSFTDGELGFRAAREMTGKYIGSHPVTIQRSKTDLKPVVQKDKYKGKNNKYNKNRDNKNDKKDKKQDDPLRAHTGAVIEKKPVKNTYKVIG
ncbi:hypothetical protein Q7P37_003332 [Cladosporium fusiforme]